MWILRVRRDRQNLSRKRTTTPLSGRFLRRLVSDRLRCTGRSIPDSVRQVESWWCCRFYSPTRRPQCPKSRVMRCLASVERKREIQVPPLDLSRTWRQRNNRIEGTIFRGGVVGSHQGRNRSFSRSPKMVLVYFVTLRETFTVLLRFTGSTTPFLFIQEVE